MPSIAGGLHCCDHLARCIYGHFVVYYAYFEWFFVVDLYARLHPSLALSLVRIFVLLQRIGNRMCFSMSAHVILQGFLLITVRHGKIYVNICSDFGTKRSQVQILSPRPEEKPCKSMICWAFFIFTNGVDRSFDRNCESQPSMRFIFCS